jgi:uncharacterized protein
MVLMSLNNSEREQLLAIARASIQHGLEHGRPEAVKLADYSATLSAQRATFVTLEIASQLRGCIGTLEAIRPLVLDVAENAFAAAFQDSRFSPVSRKEMALLDIHISILSPSEPIVFDSEDDLVRQLRPQIDGLILVEGRRRATFLPSVWGSLSEPVDFLGQLKRKAGLSAHYWSENIQAFRYTTEVIGCGI